MSKKILSKFALLLSALTLVFLPLLNLGSQVVNAAANPVLGPNLISNPSVDTPDTTGTNIPSGWTFNPPNNTGAGTTSTVSSAYITPGHTGGASDHALQVSMSNYVAGDDADWAPTAAITVTPNQAYRFSDWYESDATTEIDIEYNYASAAGMPVVTDGSCDTTALACYDQVVTSVAPAAGWTEVTGDFTVPANVTSVSVYHLLAANGTLTTDDYSLSTYAPAPFAHPMVSVTFDDGWENQYTNAFPILQSDGLAGTFYIISGASVSEYYDGSPYMNASQVVDLHNSGEEIGAHTVHHCDLANTVSNPTGELVTDDPVHCPVPLPDANVLSEMQDSKTTLQSLIGGAPVTDFAYPYGDYNANSLAIGQQVGYLSQRTTTPGYNSMDNFDATQLKMYEVDGDIPVSQVEQWIDDAISQGVWLILCYHEVADTPSDPSDTLYTTHIADFQTEMNYLAGKKAAGLVNVDTVANALQQAQNQIAGVEPPVVVPGKPGDANGDNLVDLTDLSILSSHWGTQSGATLAQGDLNSDGAVDLTDLSVLASNRGK